LAEARARRWRGAIYAAPIAVAIVTTLIWSLVRAGPYRLDDFATPLDDPASPSLSAWLAHLRLTLRPLTKLTYAIEGSLGVVGAPARRALSAAIHGVGAGALALAGRRLLRAHPRGALGAALIALVWSLHPVHAESVLSVAGRSAALGATLIAIALACAAFDRAYAAAVAIGLAVLAREATAPAGLALALLLVARAPRPRVARISLAIGLPIALSIAGTLAWTLSRPRAIALADYSFHGRPWASSVARQLAAVPLGLGLLPRPSGLSCDHGAPLPGALADPRALLGAALLLVALAVAIALARRAPIAATGAALWALALLPTQTVVPKLDAITERPIALSAMGLALLLLAGLAAIDRTRTLRRLRAPAWLVTTAAALLLARATIVRGRLYASDVALFGDASAKSVDNPRPFVELARALDEAGRREDAKRALRQALAIDPFATPLEAQLRLWEREEAARSP
jgi:tetratricopeptide (TPR) repeat protein